MRWRTEPNGLVLVDGDAITIDPVANKTTIDRVEGWIDLASQAAIRHDVPIEWLLAFILAESGGRADAVSPAGATGLMQVMPRFHDTTHVAMLEPAANVDKGASILARLRALGLDLPESASGYNAGLVASTQRPHPSESSPWGMREETPYIERVVRASNHWLGAPPPTPRAVRLVGVVPIALAVVVAGALWWWGGPQR